MAVTARKLAKATGPCVFIGQSGCTVYAERPVMCRLYGATVSLQCPFGRKPEKMLSAREASNLIKEYIKLFFKKTAPTEDIKNAITQ